MSELSPRVRAGEARVLVQQAREGVARARWAVGRAYRRTGPAGALGVVALFGALALTTGGTWRLERELDAVREHVDKLAAQTRGPGGAPHAAPQTTAQKLEAFYAFFPPLTGVPNELDKLFAAASRNGLTLEQGDYRLVEDRDGKLSRYQITLPVKGNYLKVRQFVADVLREVPAAILDSVAFKRETIAATAVEAQIKFTLVLWGHQ